MAEKNNEMDNPALAQVRRTERKVAVPTLGGKPKQNEAFLDMLVKFFVGIAIAGGLTAVVGGIIAFSSAAGINNNPNGNSTEIAEKAKLASDYVPEITKEQEEFEQKAGKDSTLDMFKKTNSGKIRMDKDPYFAWKNASGKNGKQGENGDEDEDESAAAAKKASEMMASAKNPYGTGNAGKDEKPKLKLTFSSIANNSFKNNGTFASQKKTGAGQDSLSQQSALANGGSFSNNSLNSFNKPSLGEGGKAFASAKSRISKHSANKVGSRGGGRNAFKQAKAMSTKLRTATEETNFNTARSTMDAAWEGTTADSEATETLNTDGLDYGEGMTVDPISQKEKNKTPGKTPEHDSFAPSIPDVSDMINVTPWSKELDAIRYMFLGAMALLGIAAAIADTQYGKPIAIGMAATATAACLAGVGLAITIMVKYKQTALGGMWLGICGAGVAACAVAAVAGIAAYKGAETGVMGFLAAHAKAMLMILAIVGGIGGSIGMGLDNKAVDNEKAKTYCKEHPDNSTCKDQLEQYKNQYNVSVLHNYLQYDSFYENKEA